MIQIEALIDMSETCEQSIVNNCTVNRLTEYGWWEDRNGKAVNYWHGDRNADATGCQCNDDLSCNSNNYDYICNCDSNDEAQVDAGVISSKSQLPITKLLYGDSEKRYSWIEYSLGNLVCSGKSGKYPSEERLNQLKDKINEQVSLV